MIALADSTDRLIDGMLDALGTLVLIVLFLWPLLWPLAVAVWRKLPRRRMFTLFSAAMAFGVLASFLGLVVYPVSTYLLFFAPPFQEAGLSYGHWLHAPMRVLDAWSFAWIPLAEIITSVLMTRWLTARWPNICAVLRE